MRPDMTPPLLPRRLVPLCAIPVMSLLLALAGCDLGFPSSEGEASVDRETFITVYVDLRLAALAWESARVPEAERDRILAEHGVTEDDLREFIEVHGRNVPFMTDVWHEIDARLTEELEAEAEMPGEAPALQPGGDPPQDPGDLPR